MNVKTKNKKNSLIFIFLCLFFLSSKEAFASVAELSWNANSEPDLAGYKIYWGTSPRTGTKPSDSGNGGYANIIDVKNVTGYKINTLPDTGTVYFSITAYDNNSTPNESDFSSQVYKTPGDVDKSKKVDMLDLIALVNNYNVSENGNAADVDLSGKVDMLDLIALVNNYGTVAQ